MKLAYAKCEQSGCRNQGEFMVRDKNDHFILVCKSCADKKKKPVKGAQGKFFRK
jgi:predicted metal-binding protein